MLKIATKFSPDLNGFELAWSAGFRNAEFYLNPKILEKLPDIIRISQSFPFEYVPHFPNKSVDKEVAQQTCKLYEALKCRAMVIHQPMMDEWGQKLLDQYPSIRFAVENHFLNRDQFWKWAELNPGLNLDVEHLWKFTLDSGPLSELDEVLSQFLKKYAGKLRHMHLPGFVPGMDEHRPMYCSRELMDLVWSKLLEHGYQGLVVSEIDTAYQTRQDLRMDVLLYEGWWEKRGRKIWEKQR
ncbi:MAG: hypothetical protein KDA78_01760 [Planctomycetaceae bacterium]|nr:hypothetical protein [Planctomycetaceae bacterium]